jgi:hypothetical protein
MRHRTPLTLMGLTWRRLNLESHALIMVMVAEGVLRG